MTLWIDFAMHAALVIVVWLIIPTASGRFALAPLRDRNADWIDAHPEAVRAFRRQVRGLVRFCQFWGAISLTALLLFQLNIWPAALSSAAIGSAPWEVLKDTNGVLLVMGGVAAFAHLVRISRWMKREVPLTERRSASLEPRTFDDMAPRSVRLAVYAATAIHLAAWVAVGILGWYRPRGYLGQLAFVFAVSAIVFLMTRYAVRRRPLTCDRVWGPSVRRAEMRAGLIAQSYLVVWGTLRLMEAVKGTLPFDTNRLMHLLNVGILLAAFLLLWRRSDDASPLDGDAMSNAEASRPRSIAGPGIVVLFAVSLAFPVRAFAQSSAADIPASVSEIGQILADRIDTHRQGVGIVVGMIDGAGPQVIAYGKRTMDDTRPLTTADMSP